MLNTLRLCFQKDPVTLDPQRSGDQISSTLIFHLFKGLTRLEADQTISCDLADSFHILDEGKRYVFHLGNHYWSDGKPIRAHDFVYSWKRALDPAFPLVATNVFFPIKNAERAKKGLCSLDVVGVYAQGDSVLVVELENPCPYFLELTSFCALFAVPSHVPERSLHEVCSGPFQLQQWEVGKTIQLKPNHLCKNQPNVGAIHIEIVPDEKEAFRRFEEGEIDWIGDPVCPLPVNYLPVLLLEKKIRPLAGLVSCWFNTLDTPFHNVHLRKAFASAIPRESLLQKLILPNTLLAKRLFPSVLDTGEAVPSITENQLLARKWFRRAQNELGMEKICITLTHEATDEFSRLASFIKNHLESEFNVSIQLKPLVFKEFWQRLPHHDFQMSLFCSFSQYTDVVNFLERFEFKHTPRNFSGWENSKFIALLSQYRKTSDLDKRSKLAAKAEAILLKEMPIAPLYYCHHVYMQQPYLKNLSVSPIGVIQFDKVSIGQKQLFPATFGEELTSSFG